MISPTEGDAEAWLARLWAEAREFERRTFSNVAVTLPGGVKVVEVTPIPPGDRSDVVIRDSADNVLLRNDTVAGWGLSQPQTGCPVYPTGPRIQATGPVFQSAWEFQGFITMPRFEWAYTHGTDFADTFSECRFEYQFAGGSTVVVPNSTFQSNQDTSDATTVFTVRSGTYTFPAAHMNEFCVIRLMGRTLAGGTSTASYSSPNYLNSY